MMNRYCDQTSVDLNSTVFLLDGRKIQAEQTPDEVSFILNIGNTENICYKLTLQILCITFQLKMECVEEIDAMLHQTGGTPLI